MVERYYNDLNQMAIILSNDGFVPHYYSQEVRYNAEVVKQLLFRDKRSITKDFLIGLGYDPKIVGFGPTDPGDCKLWKELYIEWIDKGKKFKVVHDGSYEEIKYYSDSDYITS